MTKAQHITVKLSRELRIQASSLSGKERKDFLRLWTALLVDDIKNSRQRSKRDNPSKGE